MRTLICFVAALCLSPASSLAADLTALETRWVRGIWPVVAFARAASVPLDIVVQPQPTPGAAPLALGFVDGRCKMVLSMRGNDEAQATLDRIEPDLLDAALELMAAHELGHCRRYLDGTWMTSPARFNPDAPATRRGDLADAYRGMRAVRREEGYADLVGLAWTWQRHRSRYARLHAWLLAERGRDLIPGSHHDTLAWVRLAQNGGALSRASIFDAAAALWGDAIERSESDASAPEGGAGGTFR
ncbi:MAG TPA: hypothetical protein VHM00_03435 [Caldimonas sp.]|jgi:hypothetical protein|nr:hypothetical protein [Caldimonas sp.]HEX2540116.1 hypothetical protein [Caldimonas sp.]